MAGDIIGDPMRRRLACGPHMHDNAENRKFRRGSLIQSQDLLAASMPSLHLRQSI